MTTPTTHPASTQRRARIAIVVNAAIVREHLGQWTRYCRLPNGEHQITIDGRGFRGLTVEEAIKDAR